MTVYIGGRKVARVGISTAGGVISSPGALTVLFSGYKVSLNNDSITPHGTGLHAASNTIAGLNTTVKIGGVLVIVDGDSTTCSHTVSA